MQKHKGNANYNGHEDGFKQKPQNYSFSEINRKKMLLLLFHIIQEIIKETIEK